MRTFAMNKKNLFIAAMIVLLILFFGCVRETSKEGKFEGPGEEIEITEGAEEGSEVEMGKEGKEKEGVEIGKGVTLITVYDNYRHNPELRTGWGFSCLVKLDGRNILFDTGGDSEILLYNTGKMKIEPEEIDSVVLSHIHGDHTGGLEGILEKNSNITVYIPESFPDSFGNRIKSYGAKFVDVSEATELFEDVYTTGELGVGIKEQSLIIKTNKGLIVITGCAHPGVVNIVRKAKEFVNERVYLVIGGFHLIGAGDSELNSIIESFRELGVQKAAPCHCSGDRTRELFREEYKEDFIENGVGRIIEIEK